MSSSILFGQSLSNIDHLLQGECPEIIEVYPDINIMDTGMNAQKQYDTDIITTIFFGYVHVRLSDECWLEKNSTKCDTNRPMHLNATAALPNYLEVIK